MEENRMPYWNDNFWLAQQQQMMQFANPYQQQMVQRDMPLNQGITTEEMNMLKERGVQGDQFFKAISKIDETAARCTHKIPGTKQITLGDVDSEGYRTCSICGTRFHAYDLDELTVKEVSEACEKVCNIMESVKLYKGDIDPNIARAIYPVTLIIKQIPNMWKNSSEYMRQYMNTMGIGANAYANTVSPYAKYNMMYYGPQAPVFGMPQPGYAPGFPAQMPPQAMPQQPVAQAPVQQAAPVDYGMQAAYGMPAVQPQGPYMPMASGGYVTQPGYVPYGTPGMPATAVPSAQNPFGYTVQGQQAQAAPAPAAPTAAPVAPPAPTAPQAPTGHFEG